MADNEEEEPIEEPKNPITQEHIEEGLSLVGKVHGRILLFLTFSTRRHDVWLSKAYNRGNASLFKTLF